VRRAERRDQHQANDEVDGGAGERHDQFLRRIARQALQAGNAPDRQQRHLRRLDAIAAGGDDVAEFMQHHAGEQEDDENGAVERGGGASSGPAAESDPDEEQDEGDVDLDRRPAESANGDRPAHCSHLRLNPGIPASVAVAKPKRLRSNRGRTSFCRP
jgi:hypothetical protein